MVETISDYASTWKKILDNLSSKIDDRRFFDVFLSGSSIFSIENGVMLVAVTSGLAVNILSTKYTPTIQEAVKEVLNQSLKVKFEQKDNLKTSVTKKEEDEPNYFHLSTVNHSLTFDNFITGDCNIEAKQAAILIAHNPGARDYNPLFIYSDSGLGKTHLLSAIYNHLRTLPIPKKCFIALEVIS